MIMLNKWYRVSGDELEEWAWRLHVLTVQFHNEALLVVLVHDHRVVLQEMTYILLLILLTHIYAVDMYLIHDHWAVLGKQQTLNINGILCHASNFVLCRCIHAVDISYTVCFWDKNFVMLAFFCCLFLYFDFYSRQARRAPCGCVGKAFYIIEWDDG